MFTNSLGEHVLVELPMIGVNIKGTDSATAAGGTAAQNHWTKMDNHGAVAVVINCDSFDGGNISKIEIQQATGATGTGLKAVKAFTLVSGPGTTGNKIVVEVQANELDTENDFAYVRAKVTHTGGTTTCTATMVYLKHQAFLSSKAWANYTLRLPQDQSAD